MLHSSKSSSDKANLLKGQIPGLEKAFEVFLPANDSKYVILARAGISYC